MSPKKPVPKKTGGSRYHHGDLRAALLEAAIEVLRERGLGGLSLRECARRLGVSHAAPYRHFGTKDALLAALVGQGFTWLIDSGLRAMQSETEPRARLDAYGVAYVHFALEHPEHHRLMFASEIDKAEFNETDRAASEGAFELLVDATAATLHDDEDPLGAAVAFWSLVHGLSMLILDGRVPDEHIASREHVEALTRSSFAHWRR